MSEVNFKTFTHKGEVLIVMSAPLERMVFTPEQAEGFAKALTEAAKQAREEVGKPAPGKLSS